MSVTKLKEPIVTTEFTDVNIVKFFPELLKSEEEQRDDIQKAYFESKLNRGKSLEEVDREIRNKYFSKKDI